MAVIAVTVYQKDRRDCRSFGGQCSGRFCNFINQPFRVSPSKAGVCDGLAIDAAAHFLAALFNIAFHHDTFYQAMNVGVQSAAV